MRFVVLGVAGLVSMAALASAGARECYRLVDEPAQYRAVEEQVIVSPARQAVEYTPAITRQVEETVTVAPEREVTHVIPPRYGYEETTALLSPARREWRTRDEGGQTIGCWVTIPAIYGHVSRRVEVEPAREVTETIPERTATRVRTEIVEPAHTITHMIPATFATRERQELASEGGERWTPIDRACER